MYAAGTNRNKAVGGVSFAAWIRSRFSDQLHSYAADLVDVSLETMTGSMAKNVKSMSNAAGGSEQFAKAFDSSCSAGFGAENYAASNGKISTSTTT